MELIAANSFENLYEKRKLVDYDAIIIISSYNRFGKLCRILHQLYTQKSKFKIKVIVYNDGSTDPRYEKIPNKYSCIYLSCQVNNGKYKYWKSINVLLKKVSMFLCHAIIQIDDDFVLCDNFIDVAMTEFFNSKKINNKYVAINYHNNSVCSMGKKIWFCYDHGVDGGSVFDFNFLKELQFKIDPIHISRWRKNPLLSSGVWYQITKKINEKKLFTYKTNCSLAFHNGNEDSKMNQLERSQNPLITPDFVFCGGLMISPKCFLCIPYSSDNPYREKAFQNVYDYYKQLGYNIFIGESEEPFNRAASRNACIPKFLDWDIVVFLDADILVPLNQIEKAITLSFQTQEMVLAYTELFLLDKNQTDFFYENNKLDGNWKKKVENQVSGAFAIPKKLWDKVGGQDERFTYWGGEDRAFYYSCAAFSNQIENKRIPGYAYHLWHEKKENEDFSFLHTNPLLCKYRSALALSEKFNTIAEQFDIGLLTKVLKADKGPLNCESKHGFLSCPTNIFTSVKFHNLPLKVNPDICVTIPCYNSKDCVKRALDSVLNQTYKNFIVFVVSDADFTSFDELRDVTDSRVYFLRTKRNIGRYAIDHYLVNHILPMFNCKYWAPIDSDDYVEPEYLNLLKRGIRNCNVVFTDQVRQHLNGTCSPVNVKLRTDERKLFRSACMLALWDLKFVIENNLTNPMYRVGWDSLMTLTAQIIGKVIVVRKPLYNIVKRPNSLTTSNETGFGTTYRYRVRDELQLIWEQVLNNPKNAHEILRKSRKKTNLLI